MITPITEPFINPAEQIELRLDGNFGTVNAKVQTNWHNGFTLYELRGPRLVGSMTVYPTRSPLAAVDEADGVQADFGNVLTVASPSYYFQSPRDGLKDPVRANGITVVGSTSTTLEALETGRFYT